MEGGGGGGGGGGGMRDEDPVSDLNPLKGNDNLTYPLAFGPQYGSEAPHVNVFRVKYILFKD